MACSGSKHAYFAQYRAAKGDPFSDDYIPEEINIDRVESRYLGKELIALRAFYDLYLSELNNPAHLEPLRVIIDTDEAKRIISRIGEIDDGLHNLQSERADMLQKLIDMADGKNAEICGRKLTLVSGGKSVAYAKAIKELLPDADLSKWTSAKKDSWRLS